MLTYTVKRGSDGGLTLKPHFYKKRGYKALESKFGHYEYVKTEQELIPYLRNGWMIRMSAPGHPPSGIRPESIAGWR